MEHIKQNNKECLEIIQKIGCFVRSCGLCAEYKTGRSLTVEQINSLWIWGKENGAINEDDNLKNPIAIMNQALKLLGDLGKFIEVGTIVDGQKILYKWAVGKYEPDTFIKKIRQGGPSVFHFVYCDEKGNTIEDPHTPDIKELDLIYIICYKYIEGKK